ncbi:MAG: sulfatase [Kiritimatiellae bacterium]|nr:sulfatase [Kiritimatiellia bacterium]
MKTGVISLLSPFLAGSMLLALAASTSFANPAAAQPQIANPDSSAAKPAGPNILWITSEDNGRFLGCYNDPNAQTPTLDALAARGVRYENFFANAPVCAVARSSWILGMPAISAGIPHMRCKYRVPEKLTPYPTLLRQAGYYVTNQSKTDYNTSSFQGNIWDQCGKEAHYKNRQPGQPFFAVFNITVSHESCVFPKTVQNHLKNKTIPARPRVAAESIKLPPYQLRTPEAVYDWQRMYDCLDLMDKQVAAILKELEQLGEAENTVVIYNSDHGGITLRSKRYLHDSGTRVPLIVYCPKKWERLAPGPAGSTSSRLTQFLDMPRTFLALCGAKIPPHYAGSVFLGESVEPAPQYVLLYSDRFDECTDLRRAITDGRWKYIRNYHPDRPRYQMLRFIWYQEGQQAQFKAFQQGRTSPAQSAQFQNQPCEELYDTMADPHEIANLVSDPQAAAKLATLQRELDREILACRDLGFMPETLMAEIDQNRSGPTIYEFAQDSRNYPLPEILNLANQIPLRHSANLPLCRQALRSSNETLRCWGVMGLRMLGPTAAPTYSEVAELALSDPAASVRINAAITIGNLGHKERACEILVKETRNAVTDPHGFWALDGIKYLEMPAAIQGLERKDYVKKNQDYTARVWALLQNGGSMRTPGGSGW